MAEKMLVGYARVDITPEQYTNLGGNGLDAKRMANRVNERLFGTCIAITDSHDETLLLCPTDTLSIRVWFSDDARKAMSEATGVPVENIMLCASHTHSGPGISSPGLETVQIWAKHFMKQMVKCAKEAMEDRKEAEMFAGQREVPGMTFVRHYHMNDGTVAGPNSGSFESGAKAHIADADNQLQVVRFVRKDDRDVVLVNWQCHPTTAGWVDKLAVSSDYIYYMRGHVEGITGTHFAFFQGAAGNLVVSSKIKDETAITPVREFDRYGTVLAEHVISCLQENMAPLQSGAVQATGCTYEGKVDHSDDHLAEKASAAREQYLNYSLDQQPEAVRMIREAGFNSFLHASGIVNRASRGETRSMDLAAAHVGDLGFTFAPYEMFCSNGMYIKEHSPFQMTFVVGYTNDYNAYMADDHAFNYDIYEVNTRHYGRGTAEILAETFVEMLNKLNQ